MNSLDFKYNNNFLSKLLESYKTFSENTIDNNDAKEILNKRINTTQSILTFFVDSLENIKSNSNNIEISNFQKSLEDSQLILKTFELEINKLNIDIAIIQKSNSELEEKLEDTKLELSNAYRKIDSLKDSLELKKEEFQTLKKEKQNDLANNFDSGAGSISDEQSHKILDGYKIDIEHLKEQLKAKEEEIIEKSNEYLQLKKDHELQIIQFQSQQSVEQTIPYKQLVEKYNRLSVSLEEYQKEIEEAHKRENLCETKLNTFKAEVWKETQTKLDALKSRISDRDNTIRNLKQELERNKELSEKLKDISDFEKQIKLLKSKLESKSKKLNRLREDVRECFSKEKSDLVYKIKFLGKQKKISDKKAIDMETEVLNLRKRLQEVGTNPDQVSIQELQKEIEELREFKKNLPNIDQITQIEELKEKLEDQKTLCHEFEQELNELSHHCEELSMYKDKQADQIRRFEDLQVEFNLERAKESKRQALLQLEKDKLLEQISHQKQLNEKLNIQLQQLLKSKASQDEALISIQKQYQLEKTTVETQRHQQTELTGIISLEKSQKEYFFNLFNEKCEELKTNQLNCVKLEENLKKLEEENDRLNDKLNNAMLGNGSDYYKEQIEDLKEQNDYLHKLINCPICHTNQKSVLITKCGHALCRNCLNNQLASRSRKCPSCNIHYSPQSEIHDLFL